MADRFLAAGIEAPVGPIASPDGSLDATETSVATNCVTRPGPAGRASVTEKTGGRPDSLAPDGMIWIAEALLRAVICIDSEGRKVLRIEGDAKGRLLLPGDLAFGPGEPRRISIGNAPQPDRPAGPQESRWHGLRRRSSAPSHGLRPARRDGA